MKSVDVSSSCSRWQLVPGCSRLALAAPRLQLAVVDKAPLQPVAVPRRRLADAGAADEQADLLQRQVPTSLMHCRARKLDRLKSNQMRQVFSPSRSAGKETL